MGCRTTPVPLSGPALPRKGNADVMGMDQERDHEAEVLLNQGPVRRPDSTSNRQSSCSALCSGRSCNGTAVYHRMYFTRCLQEDETGTQLVSRLIGRNRDAASFSAQRSVSCRPIGSRHGTPAHPVLFALFLSWAGKLTSQSRPLSRLAARFRPPRESRPLSILAASPFPSRPRFSPGLCRLKTGAGCSIGELPSMWKVRSC